MLDFDRALKLIGVIGGLFVAFLWSGGIWEYRLDKNTMRINKITGTVHALDFDSEQRRYFWNDITNYQPINIQAEEISAPVTE